MSKTNNRYVRNLLKIMYGNRCMVCSRRFNDRHRATYHHIKKVSDGGETTIENGALVCKDCHELLHSSPERERYYNKKIRRYKRSNQR